jgi:hypothetical protein
VWVEMVSWTVSRRWRRLRSFSHTRALKKLSRRSQTDGG